jgi:hypothetical protein
LKNAKKLNRKVVMNFSNIYLTDDMPLSVRETRQQRNRIEEGGVSNNIYLLVTFRVVLDFGGGLKDYYFT